MGKPKVKEEAKPIVELSGNDGNAFSIIARCSKAARRAGWPQSKIDEVLKEMKGGDYDNLLAVAQRHFDVR